MVNDDDDLGSVATSAAAPALERLDVAELRAHITRLRTEIERTEAEILKKESLRSAADRFFSSGA